MTGAGYAVLRRPVWVGGALIAVAAATVFVGLGIWQLDRHDQRRLANEAVAGAAAEAPLPVDALPAGEGTAVVEYRRVEAAGSYLPGTMALLQNRTNRGRSGFHVLAALALPGGEVLVVDRGWVPLSVIEDPAALSPPPEGPVTLTGSARLLRGGGVVNPARDGLPPRVSRVDAAALEELWATELAQPWYVELTEQEPPPPPGDPVPADPPALGAGPHLGYAFQWFAFAAITVVGFVVLARRTARQPLPADRPAGS